MLIDTHFLMLGVLKQAVADLESTSTNIRWQARAWFSRSDLGEHLFSLTRICRELGYDTKTIRARVRSGAYKPPPRRGYSQLKVSLPDEMRSLG